MPNRIIKDSIRSSDSINVLTWFEEVLFYRLIVSCDDYGRFDGRPAIIKGTCFPLKDNVTAESIKKALNKLATTGLVVPYNVCGKSYLALPSWERHQSIRAKKSRYPSQDESEMQADENICMQMQADVPVIQSESEYNTKSESEYKSEARKHALTGDSRLDDALDAYIEHRKKLKRPMTDRAIKLAINKLNDISDSIDEKIAVIDQSIENGWIGLFPLKDNSNTNAKNSREAKTGQFYDDMREWVKEHEHTGVCDDSECD